MNSEESKDIQILYENVPFGIFAFTGGQSPRITHMSKNMLQLLGAEDAPQGSHSNIELYKQNVYSMIPPEDRRRFTLYLSNAERSGKASSGEITLLRCDGSRAQFFGWLSAIEDDPDGAKFRIICVDISEWSKIRRAQETKRYLKTLSQIYDDIFEFNYIDHTVQVVYSRKSPMLRWVRNVPMDMEEATNRWILHKVPAEDREALREFFSEEAQRKHSLGSTVPQIRYKVMSSDGTPWDYSGIFVKTDADVSLFCCRKELYISSSRHGSSGKYNGDGPEIKIRTFGYFDIFVDDRPIAFRSEKAKELCALLVDRRGGYVTSEEAISFLWEDSPADPLTLSRYRKTALRLKNTLEEYGIADMIESVNGKRRIVTERVSCDLYDYLSGKEEHSQLFKGSYLTNYSWAENTLAELLQS